MNTATHGLADRPVRVRFAPSPTGYLHIGGARTALYNFLLARKLGGTFILRIEDTDLERSTPESVQAILDGMSWLGLKWDEGPFYQTQRFDFYNAEINKLVAAGKAYPCFCTGEELQAKRKQVESSKLKYRYDRTCWRLSAESRQQRISAGDKHCIRFFSTDEDSITIHDVIKGDVVVEGKELDDLIIRRTDGSPTYNLTVVVDDALMGITHVIRGDDHLNNTPRQIQLYEAMGYALPLFAHVPMILGADKKRMSKRHGATSVMAYRDMGYLPHALINYLVKLGWSHGDQEVFTMEEMIRAFNLDAVSKAAGTFNPEKLIWLNGHYIREARPGDLAPLVEEFLRLRGCNAINHDILIEAIIIGQPKVKTLLELAEFIEIFFKETVAEEDVVAKTLTSETKPALVRACEEIATAPDLLHDTLHARFEKVAAGLEVGMGKVANPVRVALSGRRVSPGVFEMIRIFGKEESLKRIGRYI